MHAASKFSFYSSQKNGAKKKSEENNFFFSFFFFRGSLAAPRFASRCQRGWSFEAAAAAASVARLSEVLGFFLDFAYFQGYFLFLSCTVFLFFLLLFSVLANSRKLLKKKRATKNIFQWKTIKKIKDLK